MQNLFMVLSIRTKADVQINGLNGKTQMPLELKWADGMFGVIPVFQDRESAEKYADGKAEVIPLYLKNNISETINLGENQSIINK